jgi:hypothetical protein
VESENGRLSQGNSDNYAVEKEKLLPNLPQNCVFVVDNAAYHNVLSEVSYICFKKERYGRLAVAVQNTIQQ